MGLFSCFRVHYCVGKFVLRCKKFYRIGPRTLKLLSQSRVFIWMRICLQCILKVSVDILKTSRFSLSFTTSNLLAKAMIPIYLTYLWGVVRRGPCTFWALRYVSFIYRQSPVKNQPTNHKVNNFYVLTKVPHNTRERSTEAYPHANGEETRHARGPVHFSPHILLHIYEKIISQFLFD